MATENCTRSFSLPLRNNCSEMEITMYEFTQDCILHVEQIDDEHRRLFQIINETLALLAQTEDVTPVSKNLLKNLTDYAATHFAHEEAYMEQIHDPELPLQRKEHAAFAKKIADFQIDDSSPQAAKQSLQELLQYLVRWLYHHILSSDMMIGKLSGDSHGKEDPFAFTEKYKTGISFVDEQHCRLFEIIRDTDALIHEQFLYDKYDQIMHLLGELKDYTASHFQDEEALMERIGYPGLAAQRRAHSAFIEKLVEIDLSELDEIDDHQQAYLLELIQFLLGWLSNHILGSDKQIGEYMREQHITAE